MVSKKKRLWAVVSLGVTLALLAVAGELVARLSGVTPWQRRDAGIRVEPGGRLFETDEILGYRHLPGRFRVRLPTGHRFRVTHGPDTLRDTGWRGEGSGGAVWLFGGSIVHGWSLDDEDTWPWRLQALVPERRVVSFGVSGYGTLHSLLQLRRALASRPSPAVVVVGYGWFHDRRNTFLRSRRKEVTAWSRLGPLVQPYARLDDAGRLDVRIAEVEYRPWPGMRRFALVHWLEERYNRIEARRADSRDVTLEILEEMRREATAAGASLLVAGVGTDAATRAVLDACGRRGIETVDLGVDLTDPRNLNLPHDNHPNAAAAARYAVALAGRLPR